MEHHETRERSKNFSLSEDRKLQEEFSKHRNYLTAPQSNKVTNRGKADIWKEIASSITSLGHANRSATTCKNRWKNLSSQAKKVYNEYKSETRRTGGGPPPKPPSASVSATIEMLKDTSKFKGVDAGIDTFAEPSAPTVPPVPTPPNVSFNDDDNTHVHVPLAASQSALPSKQHPPWQNPLLLLSGISDDEDAVTNSPSAPVSGSSGAPGSSKNTCTALIDEKKEKQKETPSSKRKHYDTTADAQLRVLQKEEELQRKKEKIMEVEMRRALLEEEVALLKKKKLELEISKLTCPTSDPNIQVVPQNLNSQQIQQLLDNLM